MAKQLKCQTCLEYGDKPDMIKDKVKYYHINECYDNYLEKRRISDQLKCEECKNGGDRADMTQENGKNIHIACRDSYLEKKLFRENEKLELDILVSIIVKVHKLHSVQSVPPAFYPFIADLRNDSVLFGKIVKKYKEGVSYELIGQTYLYCADKIAWAKANKDFKNQVLRELKYALTIVRNNIENTIRDNSKKINLTVHNDKVTQNIDMMANVGERMKEAQKTMKKEHIDVTDIF